MSGQAEANSAITPNVDIIQIARFISFASAAQFQERLIAVVGWMHGMNL
jgi:hypothetical protein